MASAKIDVLDAIIIKELLKDARKSFSEIAKENGVTNNTVGEHYSELEKSGVIQGSTIQMNHKCFGVNAVVDLQIKVQKQQLNQLLEYLARMPNIIVLSTCNPRFNVLLIASLGSVNELDQIKSEIRKQVHVLELKTHIWTGIRNIPENLEILPLKKTDSIYRKAQIVPAKNSQRSGIEIDETDRQIVEELARNSRQSFRKVAEKLGISTDTVARRYKRLTENGVVKASIQIDPSKIGYHAMLCISLALNSHNDSSEIIDNLLKIPDLTLIIKTSGEHEMQIFFLVRDIEELLSIQDEVSDVPGISALDMKITKVYSPWIGSKEYISTF